MSRGIALNLLASSLTIVAAIVLLGAAAFVGDDSLAAPDRGQREQLVWAFYDAVNATLRSEDTAALDRVVAPDLVVHSSSPTILPGRAGLLGYFAALRASTPGVQLRVEELAVAGNRAVAHVSATHDGAPDFLGLRLASIPGEESHVDAFRIADNRIVEMWSGGATAVALEPLGQVDLVPPLPGVQSLSLERLAAPTGEGWEIGPYVEPRAFVVVEGELTVEFSTSPSPLDSARVLAASGDALSIPVDSRYTVRGDGVGGTPTAFAVVTPRFAYNGPLQPQTPRENEAGAFPPSASRAGLVPLATAPAPQLPHHATVSFGRVTLPPGETVAFRKTAGTVFVAVESGVLVLRSGRAATSVELLQEESAGFAMPGTAMALANLGEAPASALLITVLPKNGVQEPLR